MNWFVVISGVAGLVLFIVIVVTAEELAWKRGYTAGHNKGVEKGFEAGHDKGLKEGFEAGKSYTDNWWIHTEKDIDQARHKIRKEGWP